MADKLEIFNRALSLIGGQLIQFLSPATPTSTREGMCELHYETSILVPAKEAMWSFLTRRQAIASDGEADFGGLNTFPIPTEAIHVHRVFRDPKYNTHMQVEDWYIEGQHILAPVETAYVIYTALPSDVEDLPEYFVEVVVRMLASRIAFPLTENSRLTETMAMAYTEFLNKAIAIDGKQARREKTTVGTLILNRRR